MKKNTTDYSRLKLLLHNLKLGFQICFSSKKAKSYEDLVEAIISYKKEKDILMTLQINTEDTRQILLDRLEDQDGIYGWNRSISKEPKNTLSGKSLPPTVSQSHPISSSSETKKPQAVPSTQTTDGMTLVQDRAVT